MSTSAVSGEALAAAAPPEMRQRQWRVLLSATMRQWRSRIGLAIFLLMVFRGVSFWTTNEQQALRWVRTLVR